MEPDAKLHMPTCCQGKRVGIAHHRDRSSRSPTAASREAQWVIAGGSCADTVRGRTEYIGVNLRQPG